MKTQKHTNKYAMSMSHRAIAAVLAGLMLVSSVPARAIAEELQDAQQAAIVQTDVGKDSTNTDTTATTDATTNADAQATTDAATTDAATTDATVAADAQATTDTADAADTAASTDASATADKQADTKSTDTKSTDTKSADTTTTDTTTTDTTTTDTTTTDTKIPESSSKDTNAKAKTSTQAHTWESYKGGDRHEDDVTRIKGIIATIGNVCGRQVGSTLVSLAGVLTFDQTAQYTSTDIMYKLYDMENEISGISTQVYNLQNALNSFKAQNDYRLDADQMPGYKEFLCSESGVKSGLIALSNALNKHMEVDENGKTTDTPCSLETPVERMPKEARDDAKKVIKDLSDAAASATSGCNLGNIESTLHEGITGGANNFVKDYFTLLNTRFNWDVETFSAKKDYITMIGQMYVNAYVAENAELRLEIADAKASGEDTSMLESQLALLETHAADVKKALFGDDGNSGFLTETRSADENKLTCYVNGQTYDKGTYACTSAYPCSVFEQAYAEGTAGQAYNCSTNWNVNSSFTADQVADMVGRLSAMKKCGCAPKKADGSEPDDILEELEALGFKNVKTDGNESGVTWNDRLASHVGAPIGGTIHARVYNHFIDLGDPSQKLLLGDQAEFHLGNRLEHSCDYVITNVTKPRMNAGSQSSWLGGCSKGDFKAYCAYGDVVNVKDGTIIHDQLLYVLHSGWWDVTWGDLDSVCSFEYYPFGCLRLGTTDPSLDAIK